MFCWRRWCTGKTRFVLLILSVVLLTAVLIIYYNVILKQPGSVLSKRKMLFSQTKSFLSSKYNDSVVTSSSGKAFNESLHSLTTLDRSNTKYQSTLSPSNQSQSDKNVSQGQDIPILFRPGMNHTEKQWLVELIGRFVTELEKANITYMLYSGSLLGSFRHHGLIPWDDDVDFLIPLTQQNATERVLSPLKPQFTLEVGQKIRWKFYSNLSHPIDGCYWRWPFIDINFYQNSTHIWDSDLRYETDVFSRDLVFPLFRRPFMDRRLPAPKDTEAVLRKSYDLDKCTSNSYSHRLERRINYEVKDCETFKSVFPFVHRVRIPGGIQETLVDKGRAINQFFQPDLRWRLKHSRDSSSATPSLNYLT